MTMGLWYIVMCTMWITEKKTSKSERIRKFTDNIANEDERKTRGGVYNSGQQYAINMKGQV